MSGPCLEEQLHPAPTGIPYALREALACIRSQHSRNIGVASSFVGRRQPTIPTDEHDPGPSDLAGLYALQFRAASTPERYPEIARKLIEAASKSRGVAERRQGQASGRPRLTEESQRSLDATRLRTKKCEQLQISSRRRLLV